jgi:hypothetical protein
MTLVSLLADALDAGVEHRRNFASCVLFAGAGQEVKFHVTDECNYRASPGFQLAFSGKTGRAGGGILVNVLRAERQYGQ